MNVVNVKTLVACVAAVSAMQLSAGLQSIDDVRVDALVLSRWGQETDTGYSNTGNPCFNYFTPNGYTCGCVATQMSQLFRYWRYPASIASSYSLCLTDSVEQLLPYGGGAYDYAAMPYEAAGSDEASRAAIGQLVYDCAVSMHADFRSDGTYSYGIFSFVQLRETFGYASAVGYVPFMPSSPTDALKNTIIANLDAKCPVMITLSSSSNLYAHQALIDGYGYHEGKLYFHFNMGWCNIRGDDAWYELGKVVGYVSETSTYYFDRFDGLVYNVFPNHSGEVLSGRVLDESGSPVANATVQAMLGSKVVDSVQTDAKGIYAFVLAGDVTYKVSCGGNSISVSLPSSVSAKRMTTKTDEGDIWENPLIPVYSDEGKLGGSSGNDIVKGAVVPPAPDSDPDPAPDSDPDTKPAVGPFNPAKASKGEYPYSGAVYDEYNNPRGIISIKFTKPSKGKSKISGTVKMMDGKSYSLAATPVEVSGTESAKVVGKDVKKLGKLNMLEIGEKGFVAEITMTGGTKLMAKTTDLSVGLSKGTDYTFGVSGIPSEINGLEVVSEMLPDGQEVPVDAKGKIALAKAATLKYAKIKGTKPAEYELVCDTSKGKTNLSGLKLTYTAKTSTIKGSFNVYTVNEAKHKVNKVSFTVNGMVIGGKAVGGATCKKPVISCPVVLE